MEVISHKLENRNIVKLFTYRLKSAVDYQPSPGFYKDFGLFCIDIGGGSNIDDVKRSEQSADSVNLYRWYRDIQFLAKIIHNNGSTIENTIFNSEYYDELHHVKPRIASATIDNIKDELPYLSMKSWFDRGGFTDKKEAEKLVKRSLKYTATEQVDGYDKDLDKKYSEYLISGDIELLYPPSTKTKIKRWWNK